MNKKQTIIFCSLLILLLASWAFIAWLWYSKPVDTSKEQLESNIRLESLVKDYASLRSERDSIKFERDSLKLVILSKKKSYKKIIKKNEATHENISNLTTSESYLLFTNNAKEYRENRERYSLQRFR